MKPFKKQGFTLAEVLITLGIIGVVAAMTIPTLINNYQKNVTITRLKHTYSTLMQMFKLAEADHGSMDTWGMSRFAGTGTNVTEARETFVNTYMLPYLANAIYERKPISQVGYTDGIKYPNGEYAIEANATASPLILKNGVILIPAITSYRDENNVSHYASIAFYTDINGANGENTVGKDIFILQKLFDNTGVTFYGEKKWTFSYDTHKFTFSDPYSRDELFNYCKTGDDKARLCGALIKFDGWKISNDYPWYK